MQIKIHIKINVQLSVNFQIIKKYDICERKLFPLVFFQKYALIF